MKLKIALAVVIVLSLSISAFACAAPNNSVLSSDGAWYYAENEEDGSVTLLSYKGSAENVVIPATVDDKVVSALGEKIFVNINDGSTKKRDNGVYEYNTTLKTVEIQAEVKSIPNMAFYLCVELTDVIFSTQKVKSVEAFAFYGCKKLQSITLPASCESIGAYCFRECLNLKTVNLSYNGDSIVSIGDKAFYNIDNQSDSDDQYYIIKDLQINLNNLDRYEVGLLEQKRKETKDNSYKYWQEYANAGCLKQLTIA